MNVVGGHRLEAELRGELEQARGDLALRFQAVVVDFDVDVLLAEDVDQLGHRLARLAFVAEQQPLVDRAGNAAAQADDALGELAERGAVDPRLAVVEALEVAERDELLQVAPAFVGLGQQRHVAGPLAAGDVLLVLQIAGGEVDLAAEDRLHPGLLAGLVELDGAEQVAVVGHRHRRHPELLRLGGDLLGAGHPVEERVFGVQVEVDEGVGHRAGRTLDGEAGEGKQEGGAKRSRTAFDVVIWERRVSWGRFEALGRRPPPGAERSSTTLHVVIRERRESRGRFEATGKGPPPDAKRSSTTLHVVIWERRESWGRFEALGRRPPPDARNLQSRATSG